MHLAVLAPLEPEEIIKELSMKPIFIEFEKTDGDKVIFNISNIKYITACRDVNDNHTMIYARDSGIALNESYDDVCGKIRNALNQAHA